MVNRIAAGIVNPTRVGLYISKPGFDVTTTPDSNMLLSTDNVSWQAVQSGRVALPKGGTLTITHPNLGYYPAIYILPHLTSFGYFSSNNGKLVLTMFVTHNSLTSATLHLGGTLHPTQGYVYSGFSTYVVMRQTSG